jgi:integrase
MRRLSTLKMSAATIAMERQSDAVAQDLVGHESAEVSRLYNHIDDKAKRAAVNKLPAIGQK